MRTRFARQHKAALLVSQRRISWTQGCAIVTGDHQRYLVQRTATGWTCTCRWAVMSDGSQACSHVLAAQATEPQHPLGDGHLAENCWCLAGGGAYWHFTDGHPYGRRAAS